MQRLEEKISEILALELYPQNRDLTLEPSYYLFLLLSGEVNVIQNLELDLVRFIDYLRHNFGEKVVRLRDFTLEDAYEKQLFIERKIFELQDYVPEKDDGSIKYHYRGRDYKIFYGVDAEDIYDWLQSFEIVYSELEDLFIKRLNISPMKFFSLALLLQEHVVEKLIQNEEYQESLSEKEDLLCWHFPKDKTWFDDLRKSIAFSEEILNLILEEKRFTKEEKNFFFSNFVISLSIKEGFNDNENTFIEDFYSNEIDTYWFIKIGNLYYLRSKKVSLVLINNFARVFKKNFYTDEVLKRIKDKLVDELAHRILENIDYVRVLTDSEIKDENGINYKSDLLLIIDNLYFVPLNIIYPPNGKKVDITEERGKLRINADFSNPNVKAKDLITQRIEEVKYSTLISEENFFPIVVFPVLDFGRYQISSDEIDRKINFIGLDEFLGLIDEVENGPSLISFLKQFKNLKDFAEISALSSFAEFFAEFKLKGCLSFGGLPFNMISLLHVWSDYRHGSLSKKWNNIIKFRSTDPPFAWKIKSKGENLFFAFIPNTNLQADVMVIKQKYFLWFVKPDLEKDTLINNFLSDVLVHYLSNLKDFLYENLDQYEYLRFHFYSVSTLYELKDELKDLINLVKKEELDKPYSFVVNKQGNLMNIAVIYNENTIFELFSIERQDNTNELEFVKKLLSEIGLKPETNIFNKLSGKPRNVYRHVDIDVPINEHLPPPLLPMESERCFVENLTYKSCYKYGYKPGQYFGENAKNIINDIVRDLETFLLNSINKYNKEELLNLLIFEIESTEFDFFETAWKVKTGIETYIEHDPVDLWSEAINDEGRLNRIFDYLIEFVLKNHCGNPKQHITNIDFLEILALGEQLLELYFVSENIHFGIWSEYGLEITDTYVIRQIQEEPEDFKKMNTKKAHEILVGEEPALSSANEDDHYLNKLDEAFKRSVGFTFSDLSSVILMLFIGEYDNDLKPIQIFNSKPELLDKLVEIANEKRENYPLLNINFISKILDYLILRKENINDCNPMKLSNDENKFRIKPLIELDDGKIMFGRFAVNRTYKIWAYRILDGFFPYPVDNYPEIRSVINDKRNYLGNRLEEVIFDAIRDTQMFDICKKDFDLHNSLGEEYPQELGDFDAFCISKIYKEIWLIEAKNLRVSFVPREISREYTELFNKLENDKRVDYATKFLRRVLFVKQNFSKIFERLGIRDADDSWKIKSYFVMRNLSYNLFNIPKEFDEIEFLDLQDFLTLLNN